MNRREERRERTSGWQSLILDVLREKKDKEATPCRSSVCRGVVMARE